MRKSVMQLAISDIEKLVDADNTVCVAEWWAGLHPRSKVVIGAKLRERSSYNVLFVLASIAHDAECGRDLQLEGAELRAALAQLGLEEAEVEALAPESGARGLAEWVGALPEEQRKVLDAALGDEQESPPSPDADEPKESKGLLTLQSSDAAPDEAKPEPDNHADAIAAALAASAEAPDHDPLGSAVGVRVSGMWDGEDVDAALAAAE